MLDNEVKLTVARLISIVVAVAGIAGSAVSIFLEYTKISQIARDNDALHALVQRHEQAAQANTESLERGKMELTECKQSLRTTPQTTQGAELAQCTVDLQYVRTENTTLSAQLAESAEKLKQAQAENQRLRDSAQTTTTPSIAEAPHPQPPAGKAREIEWRTNANDWRNNVGQRFAFFCPSGGAVQDVYGNEEYASISSICTAAAHAGKITAVGGGTVTIHILGTTGITRRGQTNAGIRSRDVDGRRNFSMFKFE